MTAPSPAPSPAVPCARCTVTATDVDGLEAHLRAFHYLGGQQARRESSAADRAHRGEAIPRAVVPVIGDGPRMSVGAVRGWLEAEIKVTRRRLEALTVAWDSLGRLTREETR